MSADPNDLDARLKAALAYDAPPGRDLAFQAAVMEKVARRRLWLSLAYMAPVLFAAMAVLWSVAPAVEPLASELALVVQPVIGAVAAVLFLAFVSGRLPSLARR